MNRGGSASVCGDAYPVLGQGLLFVNPCVLYGLRRKGMVGLDPFASAPHHSGSFGSRDTTVAPAALAGANKGLPPFTNSPSVSHGNSMLVQTPSGIVPVICDNSFVQPPPGMGDIANQLASLV